MKKTILFCLIAALAFSFAFSFASCAKDDAPDSDKNDKPDDIIISDGETDGDTNPDADADADKTADSARVVTLSDGRTIEIGAAADAAIALLGEYDDMYEAPSCVHEGYDRFYTYDGFSVTTAPQENGDIVTEFLIESSACTLANGITIGSSAEDVTAAYGEDYSESFGTMRYEYDGVTLTIVTDGTSVTSVLFSQN